MLTKQQEELVKHYNDGLALYKDRKFREAKAKFEEGLKCVAEDGPCLLYIDRCNEYIEHPPGDDWDGVYVMKTK